VENKTTSVIIARIKKAFPLIYGKNTPPAIISGVNASKSIKVVGSFWINFIINLIIHFSQIISIN